jgi:hypothetical protein
MRDGSQLAPQRARLVVATERAADHQDQPSGLRAGFLIYGRRGNSCGLVRACKGTTIR